MNEKMYNFSFIDTYAYIFGDWMPNADGTMQVRNCSCGIEQTEPIENPGENSYYVYAVIGVAFVAICVLTVVIVRKRKCK